MNTLLSYFYFYCGVCVASVMESLFDLGNLIHALYDKCMRKSYNIQVDSKCNGPWEL